MFAHAQCKITNHPGRGALSTIRLTAPARGADCALDAQPGGSRAPPTGLPAAIELAGT